MEKTHTFEDTDTFLFEQKNTWFTTGEHALWYSVLKHALRDADHHRQILKMPRRKPKRADEMQGWLFDIETTCERHDDLLELLAWFEAEVDHIPGTFGFICNCLGISDEGRAAMVRWARNRIIARAKLAA